MLAGRLNFRGDLGPNRVRPLYLATLLSWPITSWLIFTFSKNIDADGIVAHWPLVRVLIYNAFVSIVVLIGAYHVLARWRIATLVSFFVLGALVSLLGAAISYLAGAGGAASVPSPTLVLFWLSMIFLATGTLAAVFSLIASVLRKP